MTATCTPDAEPQLWQLWRAQEDMAAREALVLLFQPYARTMAAVLYKGRTHDDVGFDDYLQLATVGLIEAVERYDPSQGAQFKTFAAHRIRGAILNGLEKQTEKSQQIAFGKKLRADRLDAIKAEARNRTGVDSASNSSLTPAKQQQALLDYLAEVGIGLAMTVMLEGTAMLVAGDNQPDLVAAASPEVSYFKKSETQHLQTLLRELLDRLPDQERRVLRYHYQQDVSFDDISAMLGVTRGRISQLHRQALRSLRDAFGKRSLEDVLW